MLGKYKLELLNSLHTSVGEIIEHFRLCNLLKTLSADNSSKFTRMWDLLNISDILSDISVDKAYLVRNVVLLQANHVSYKSNIKKEIGGNEFVLVTEN